MPSAEVEHKEGSLSFPPETPPSKKRERKEGEMVSNESVYDEEGGEGERGRLCLDAHHLHLLLLLD